MILSTGVPASNSVALPEIQVLAYRCFGREAAGSTVVPYNGGEAPIDKERFVNARAEDYTRRGASWGLLLNLPLLRNPSAR
jgi:hypothetical protein